MLIVSPKIAGNVAYAKILAYSTLLWEIYEASGFMELMQGTQEAVGLLRMRWRSYHARPLFRDQQVHLF